MGALLALPSGCAAPLVNIAQIDLDAIGPDQVLLLGCVRVTALEMDRTSDTFIRSTAQSGEKLLPPDGEVAWLVHRRRGIPIHLSSLSSGSLWAMIGVLAAPGALPVPISYFGTVSIEIGSGPNNRSSGRVGSARRKVVDDHAAAMRSFVDQNPALAQRPYYNVITGAVVEAPIVRRPLQPT
ncbi:MAG: hypothetical protein U0359_24065 [Byssovorax sp.]